MCKPIIKAKIADNGCYNDTVIVIPQLDDNFVKTQVCSFVEIFCIASVAFCTVASIYLLFNNIFNNLPAVKLSSAMDMDTMGDIYHNNINGYIA